MRLGSSVCDGDSGGGMFFARDGHYFIRGITSVAVTNNKVGIRQCDPSQYFLFTDVSYLYDWIYDQIIGGKHNSISSRISKGLEEFSLELLSVNLEHISRIIKKKILLYFH